MSTLHDKIEAFGEAIKEILHELATFGVEAAPVAEMVESVVAPEDVAPTEAAAAIANKIDQATATPTTPAS